MTLDGSDGWRSFAAFCHGRERNVTPALLRALVESNATPLPRLRRRIDCGLHLIAFSNLLARCRDSQGTTLPRR